MHIYAYGYIHTYTYIIFQWRRNITCRGQGAL